MVISGAVVLPRWFTQKISPVKQQESNFKVVIISKTRRKNTK